MLYMGFENLLKYLEEILKKRFGEFEQKLEGILAKNEVSDHFHVKIW